MAQRIVSYSLYKIKGTVWKVRIGQWATHGFMELFDLLLLKKKKLFEKEKAIIIWLNEINHFI